MARSFYKSKRWHLAWADESRNSFLRYEGVHSLRFFKLWIIYKEKQS